MVRLWTKTATPSRNCYPPVMFVGLWNSTMLPKVLMVILMDLNGDLMGFDWDLPFGKLTFCYGKIHHAIHGKIQELSMAIFNSEVLVYQRVNPTLQPRYS